VAVVLDVRLRRFSRVMSGVLHVSVGGVSVVRGALVISRLVVVGCLAMVPGGVLVVFGCVLMMLCCVFCHGDASLAAVL
jgi:hypothetical protein